MTQTNQASPAASSGDIREKARNCIRLVVTTSTRGAGLSNHQAPLVHGHHAVAPVSQLVVGQTVLEYGPLPSGRASEVEIQHRLEG